MNTSIKKILRMLLRYLLGGLGLIFLAYTLLVAGGILMMSPMLFDAPGPEESLWTRLIIFGSIAYICGAMYAYLWLWKKVFKK